MPRAGPHDVTAGTAAGISRAATMIDLRRYHEAAALLASIVAAAPDLPRAWCLLARAQLGAGRGADAVLAARRAGALSPGDDWPWRLASTALVSLGRGPEAVAAAQRARRLAPGYWRPQVCVAQAAIAAGDPALAGEAARAALAIAPHEADVQFTAGKAALAAGDLSRARGHQQAALAIDPGHAGAVNELGRISLRERDPGTAAGYFLRAARAAPGVAVFGRNTEVALARLAIGLAVPAAGVLAVVLCLPVLTPVPLGPGLAMTAGLAALAGGYGWLVLRRLPADARRHLSRMVRRRQWLAAIGAVACLVPGLVAGVALLAAAPQAAARAAVPAAAVIAAVLAARLLVVWVIRHSRRMIR
ncbi:MAG TPA: tetratricopeptide repeat protein [Streptosporangiaceae bacterium]|nr:tetratricopeptide repeat protein [Streptosporangiaceae bacterium]